MRSFWTSSIGKKVLMAITGLVLIGFVIGHMVGNLSIFAGQDAINDYAVFLKSLGGGLWVVRFGLLTALVVHVVVAYQLTVENRRARPTEYVVKKSVQANAPSYYMGILGSLILFYIVFHLLHFTIHQVDPSYSSLVDSKGRHDVYSMVIKGFQDPLIAWGYVAAMFVLAAHLWHGIPSFFQSLGFRHPTLSPLIAKLGPLVAVVIALGYIAVPLAVQGGIVQLPTTGVSS